MNNLSVVAYLVSLFRPKVFLVQPRKVWAIQKGNKMLRLVKYIDSACLLGTLPLGLLWILKVDVLLWPQLLCQRYIPPAQSPGVVVLHRGIPG